ncbi:pectate lyase [Pedobacter sp. P351]|uniref:pectate lyase n=1 Tax=Pedobacter superstes TaxID=3133441 RepID=UPI0030984B28
MNFSTALIFAGSIFLSSLVSAQETQKSNYLDLSWKQVAAKMPDSWYGSNEAKLVAENVLIYQKDIGGWTKNLPLHHPLTSAQKAQIIKDKSEIGATFDNGATLTEMIFLSKVYTVNQDPRYYKAFEKGFNYILEAQYDNGGWPQFYPFRKGNSVAYATHITYNDDAIVNVLRFLKDITEEKSSFAAMPVSKELKQKAKASFDKGIDCILKTQIKIDGKPTVWCAQHDEFTFAPANARAYELASFSGSESVGITMLLMDINSPSKEIVNAVKGSVKWFETNKIEGIKLDSETDQNGKKNRIVVEDKSAPAIWARFYDLETGKPYFSDRDGVKKNTLAEIGHERRNGYSWYTNSPEKLIKTFPQWAKKWGVN